MNESISGRENGICQSPVPEEKERRAFGKQERGHMAENAVGDGALVANQAGEWAGMCGS